MFIFDVSGIAPALAPRFRGDKFTPAKAGARKRRGEACIPAVATVKDAAVAELLRNRLREIRSFFWVYIFFTDSPFPWF